MSTTEQDTDFRSLKLPAAQIENLAALGYTQMTPVQAQALPSALAGEDLIVQAKTGSGKTAAFGIALLHRINPRDFGAQALILCPTRELSTQVATEIRKLARYQPNLKLVVLCGGQSIGPQIGSLEHGAHIVVGTPGRIRDHLEKQTLALGRVNTLVLDEADRMLDMGFSDDIAWIISHTPASRQTMLFSATFPEDIDVLSSRYQREAKRISIDTEHTQGSIVQHFFSCGASEQGDNRLAAILRLLRHFTPSSCVIFCNTRQSTANTARYLTQAGYRSLPLHGEMEQRERDQVLIQFRNGSCPLLVATDVAARGLDIDSLSMVVNAELPRDPEVYTHRIGRTGRAGQTGMAISVFFEDERFRVDKLRTQNPGAGAINIQALALIPENQQPIPTPLQQTLDIAGGRKNKIRPGDILGALTAEGQIPASAIGRIDILEHSSFVAIDTALIGSAIRQLESGRIKGQKFRVRKLGY
jgi:ATP-independent RNA helicase DbpA